MPTKLIEVALPLDIINGEAAREKSIRHGHPSTLHLWWARRPLAACRAVLFAQLVDGRKPEGAGAPDGPRQPPGGDHLPARQRRARPLPGRDPVGTDRRTHIHSSAAAGRERLG
jgi:hypothetical protein